MRQNLFILSFCAFANSIIDFITNPTNSVGLSPELPSGAKSTLSVAAHYSLLRSKTKTGLKLVYSSNSTNNSASANQLLTQLSYSHQLIQKLNYSFNSSINSYLFGEEKPDVRYRETLI